MNTTLMDSIISFHNCGETPQFHTAHISQAQDSGEMSPRPVSSNEDRAEGWCPPELAEAAMDGGHRLG